MTVKFDASVVERWKEMAQKTLDEWLISGLRIGEVKTGRDAWVIAHRAGIVKEAYSDPLVTDGHIQTALEKVFPNAVFKDLKRY